MNSSSCPLHPMTPNCHGAGERWAGGQDVRERQALLAAAGALCEAYCRGMKKGVDDQLRVAHTHALELAEEMVAIGRQTATPLLEALGEMACGNAMLYLDFTKAIAHYDQAHTLGLRIQNELETMRSQVGKIYALMRLGRYVEAIAIGPPVCAAMERHEAWLSAIRSASNLANCYKYRGEFALALATFKRADAIASQHCPEERPMLGLNKALVYIETRDYLTAKSVLEGVQALIDPTKSIAGRILLAWAHIEAGLGNINQALRYFERSIEAFNSHAMPSDELIARTELLAVLIQLNEHHRILDEVGQLNDVLARLNAKPEEAYVAYCQGIALRGLGQLTEAATALERAGELFTALGRPIWSSRALVELSRVQILSQRLDQAGRLARDAAAVFAAQDLAVDLADARIVMAQVLARQGAADQALALFQELADLARNLDLPWLIIPAASGAAALLESADPAAAHALYAEAVAAIERMRQRVSAHSRSHFLADKSAAYQGAVRTALALSDPGLALHFVQRNKSRTLYDLLAGHARLPLQANQRHDSRIVRLMELGNQVSWYFSQLHDPTAEQVTMSADASAAHMRDLRDRLRACEHQFHALLARLSVEAADETRDAALLLGAIPEPMPRLPAGVALVEYYSLASQTIAFVQHGSRLRVVTDGLMSPRQIARLTADWGEHMLFYRSDDDSADQLAEAQTLLRAGYDGVIAPLKLLAPAARRRRRPLGASRRPVARHLIIAPHGPLHQLPIHAFFDGKAYLNQRLTCSYVPAGYFVRFHLGPERPIEAPPLVLGFSNNGELPCAVSEAVAVAEQLGVKAHLEDQACASALHDQRRRAVIHIATHANTNPTQPLCSSLVLADRHFNVLDMFAQPLSTELLTLSACATGRNVIEGGDELIGWIGACLHSGGNTLLLSQWPVQDDSTASLMAGFYAGLRAGRSRAGALRLAQRALLRSAHAHPFHWAPFFLVGSWRPLAINGRARHSSE